MIQVREGVFETNSSSVHSLTMCSKESYERWKNKKLYWGGGVKDGDLVLLTMEEALNEVERKLLRYGYGADEITDALLNYYLVENYPTCDNYYREYCEDFEEEYVSPNGDHVIAFGYYGYDG